MRTNNRFIHLILLSVLLLSCTLLNRVPGKKGGSSLPDPSVGLSALAAYKASLALSFEGIQMGSESRWSMEYTLSVGREPQVWVLTYHEDGLETLPGFSSEMEGYSDGVSYSRSDGQAPCLASFADEDFDPASAFPELAGRLPALTEMSSAGAEETINGILTQPYVFDISGVTDTPGGEATGKLWLAREGNYLVRYELGLTGGNDFFDADTAGTFTWVYQLELLDANTAEILPLDCPIPLPELPTLEAAENLSIFPGYMTYETSTAPDDVLNYYQENPGLNSLSLVDDRSTGSEGASMVYTDGRQNITFTAVNGTPTRVHIIGQRIQGLAVVTPQPTVDVSAQSTEVAGDPQSRVVNALNYLIGQDPEPSALDSFHMESHQLTPRWDSSTSSVALYENWLNVDAEGENIHFTNQDNYPDGSQAVSEVYLMGDKEYEMINGVATEGLGLASLTWIMWPLDPTMLLGIGSLRTVASETEALEGRTAEVYQINGTSADDPTGILSGFGFKIIRLDGQVWVDAETGALLKAMIDYDAEVKDDTGTVRGTQAGLLAITVSQVNLVNVELP